jgi:hypothetical protein
VFFYCIHKSSTPSLLFTLDEENEINAKGAILKKFCSGASYSHNGALIIGHPPSIKITVTA